MKQMFLILMCLALTPLWSTVAESKGTEPKQPAPLKGAKDERSLVEAEPETEWQVTDPSDPNLSFNNTDMATDAAEKATAKTLEQNPPGVNCCEPKKLFNGGRDPEANPTGEAAAERTSSNKATDRPEAGK